MNKVLFLIFIIIASVSYGQAPRSFKYQAVVRNATGILLNNQVISVKTSILKGNAFGEVVYSEFQTVSTNEYGVVNINIGEGSLISGTFYFINWGDDDYFIKTELDLNGQNSNYVFMGTSQIMSVPYAIFSEKSGRSLNDEDTSATNEIQLLSITGSELTLSNGNTVTLPPDADNNPTNEIQQLTIVGNQLTLSNNGNSVIIPPDADSDPTNEIQTIQLVGDSLKISNGNAILLTSSVDLDASPLNELQNLSLNGNELSIQNGNTIILPTDADSDPTNELQDLSLSNGTLSIDGGNNVHLPDSSATNELQSLSLNGNELSISNGNSVNLPTQTLSISGNQLTISSGNSVQLPSDGDTNPTNEIQNLQLNGNVLSISNGNNVTLPTDADSNPTNELQTLQIVGDSLKISNGNSVLFNPNKRYLGEYWGGGIIFLLYNDTLGVQHGLIMSKNIMGPEIWGTSANINATSKFDGMLNTQLINSTGNSAAIECLNYVANDNSGVYTDWYLPSLNELKIMLEFSNNYEFFINGNNYLDYKFWSSTGAPTSGVIYDAFYITNSLYYTNIGQQYRTSPDTYFRPIRKF